MQRVAKFSGLAYLMIFLTGFYANFAVLESLVDINNPYNTTVNFINNHSQLGYGLSSFVLMVVCDLLLVWSLFGLTKSFSKNISYLASFFRLLHALFFSIALFKLFQIYQLTSYTVNSLELQDQVTKLISAFDTLWTIGLLFFGVHLLVLGYLIVRSKNSPKALGVLLLLAAVGYIIDGMAKLFMSNYTEYGDVFETIVLLPAIIGEFSFTVWLLIQGFRKPSPKQKIKTL